MAVCAIVADFAENTVLTQREIASLRQHLLAPNQEANCCEAGNGCTTTRWVSLKRHVSKRNIKRALLGLGLLVVHRPPCNGIVNVVPNGPETAA